MKISNLLIERIIKLVYVILSLYLGANFFSSTDFLILQQISLFQSFLIFSIGLPATSILLRLGNSSLKYFKEIVVSTAIVRSIVGLISLFVFSGYLYFAQASFYEILLIFAGLVPTYILSVFFSEILPHVFNFEGKKNWQLIIIMSVCFLSKILVIILVKMIFYKILVEIFEAVVILIWICKTYLIGLLKTSHSKIHFKRLVFLIKSSLGLYINGILSVFILRIDQFLLIKYVNKQTLSSYMLIVSIASLFLIPMSLLGDRLAFVLNIAKRDSMLKFRAESIKYLFLFSLGGISLFLLFAYSFEFFGRIAFKRDLHQYYGVGLFLGFSIVSNSIGMVLGQINSIFNGGYFTMIRSLIGCVLLTIGVSIGYNLYGIIGVSVAGAITLFLTNTIFWFRSKRIRAVFFS